MFSDIIYVISYCNLHRKSHNLLSVYIIKTIYAIQPVRELVQVYATVTVQILVLWNEILMLKLCIIAVDK